jgi:mRNA-degrading endonuclease RelE of RelBE toxin-antitoxin system
VQRVEWSEPAAADMASLERSIANRITKAVERFADSGLGDVKKLQGVDPVTLRLRVGDYRVFFRDRGESIRVVGVRNRKEAYR